MSQGSPATARQRPRPSLLYAVKQVELIVRAHLDDLLRDSGVTALQYTALTVLARRDGLTSAELARNSFVTPQAMADLVNSLERGGFIVRRRNPENRRQLLISLTADGDALLARFDDPVARIETRMLDGFDDADRERFRDYLNRARSSLEG
ncbi:MarR family transcriptional regulator [Actinomycetospora sp. TBRC 11914]|uniref:MarR family winged helix-turn-helix transcriptional regulator n=1 Tax=Actinomycetospora sp. TBRC 11914 TaxID=2729387 RepID=UPI002896E0D2|nr:MarR family transcriptional regulator [Actinomycetospora sp. TBRC 11914]